MTTIHSEHDAFEAILDEFHRARRIHPVWPGDPIHAAAVVSEEAGELVKAVNDWMTGKCDRLSVGFEAIQLGAMAVRFLVDTAALQPDYVAPVTSVDAKVVATWVAAVRDQDAEIQRLRGEVERLTAMLQQAPSAKWELAQVTP